MNEDWPLEGLRADIPTELLDDQTGKPFSHCRMCALDLHEPTVPYMVEKVVRKNLTLGLKEDLFAYAICLDCVEEMKSSISKESAQVIQKFISENVHFQRRMERLFFGQNLEMEEMMGKCMLSSKPIAESVEYQMAALCEGNELILGMWPYVVDSEMIVELSSMLSEETLGNMDDFYAQNFGLPPEWADLFKDRPVFWI